MKPIRITNTETLQLEKERIQLMLETKEAELKESGNYIRTNARKIIWKTVNPFKDNAILNVATEIAGPVLEAAGTTTGKGVAATLIKDLLVEYVPKLAAKWLKKKKARKKKKQSADTAESKTT